MKYENQKDGGVAMELNQELQDAEEYMLPQEDIKKRHEESRKYMLKMALGFFISAVAFWIVYLSVPGLWKDQWMIGMLLPMMGLMSLLCYVFKSRSQWNC